MPARPEGDTPSALSPFATIRRTSSGSGRCKASASAGSASSQSSIARVAEDGRSRITFAKTWRAGARSLLLCRPTSANAASGECAKRCQTFLSCNWLHDTIETGAEAHAIGGRIGRPHGDQPTSRARPSTKPVSFPTRPIPAFDQKMSPQRAFRRVPGNVLGQVKDRFQDRSRTVPRQIGDSTEFLIFCAVTCIDAAIVAVREMNPPLVTDRDARRCDLHRLYPVLDEGGVVRIRFSWTGTSACATTPMWSCASPVGTALRLGGIGSRFWQSGSERTR